MNGYEIDHGFDKLRHAIREEFSNQETVNVTLRTEITRLNAKVDDLEKKLEWLIKGNLSDGEIQRLLDEA